MSNNLLFEAKNISKDFNNTKALQGIYMHIEPREIIGLVGENGSGKSTLQKIIMGLYPPSSGEMFVRGEKYAPLNPSEAGIKGIGMVFQEQALIANLSVGQNIFLGREKNFKRHGLIKWSSVYAKSKEVLDSIGCEYIKPKTKVSDLNFATRQMIEIAKVINIARSANHDTCLVLFDEPTSVLNENEVSKLFEEIKHLKSDGHSVVFVSHRLDEVLEISDRIYVFKDGMVNGNLKKDDANNAKLYELMVGRVTPIEYYHLEQQIKPAEEIVLQVKELGLKGAFKYVSFDLHRGEIIGFCGTVGSGKEDLCHVLCGDDKQTEGRILLKNKKHELQHVLFNNPNEALMEGIIMIPKERLEEGVIANLSIDENIALSSYKHLTNGPFIIGPKKDKQSDEWIKKLRIKTAGREELLSQLSGGNQQKVVFARALASESEIIILNHPTRGVDVGAKEEIYAMIRECAKMGKSIILLGDTLEECIGMSNRILVMKDGVVTGELKAEADSKPSQVQIVSLMM